MLLPELVLLVRITGLSEDGWLTGSILPVLLVQELLQLVLLLLELRLWMRLLQRLQSKQCH